MRPFRLACILLEYKHSGLRNVFLSACSGHYYRKHSFSRVSIRMDEDRVNLFSGGDEGECQLLCRHWYLYHSHRHANHCPKSLHTFRHCHSTQTVFSHSSLLFTHTHTHSPTHTHTHAHAHTHTCTHTHAHTHTHTNTHSHTHAHTDTDEPLYNTDEDDVGPLDIKPT